MATMFFVIRVPEDLSEYTLLTPCGEDESCIILVWSTPANFTSKEESSCCDRVNNDVIFCVGLSHMNNCISDLAFSLDWIVCHGDEHDVVSSDWPTV